MVTTGAGHRHQVWWVMVVMLLSHQTMAGVRIKRQEEQEDTLTQLTSFLDSLEGDIVDTLYNLIDSQEAQDRILLEDVQVSKTAILKI